MGTLQERMLHIYRKIVWFWQPYVAVSSESLSANEQKMLTDLNWIFVLDEDLINLFSDTYEYIEEAAEEHEQLYYWGDIFGKQSAQVWIDTWGHVTPEGNALIAQHMAATITEIENE